MPSINLQLKTKEQINLVVNAIKQQKENLKVQLAEIEKEIFDLDILLSQMQTVSQLSIVEGSNESYSRFEYSSAWPYSRKAAFVINKIGHPATTSEIADYILKHYEPNEDRKKIVRNLSVTFATQKKRFKQEKNENEENIYTLVK